MTEGQLAGNMGKEDVAPVLVKWVCQLITAKSSMTGDPLEAYCNNISLPHCVGAVPEQRFFRVVSQNGKTTFPRGPTNQSLPIVWYKELGHRLAIILLKTLMWHLHYLYDKTGIQRIEILESYIPMNLNVIE